LTLRFGHKKTLEKKLDAMKRTEKKYEEVFFVNTEQLVWNYSLFTDKAVKDFLLGKNYALYYVFGSKKLQVLDRDGYYFAVWAPNAQRVTVISDFTAWNNSKYNLHQRTDGSGIWEGFIPDFPEYMQYKYKIKTKHGISIDKGDPFAHRWQLRPNNSSITQELTYKWADSKWMKKRVKHNALHAAWSVYELHLGSWRKPDAGNESSFYNYREIAEQLIDYILYMGFTHVELMPITEYPYDGSWGYQCTGYFAPTSRFGTPQDLMYMIDQLHQHNIGVIMDWVPSHFPHDAHGLFMFDGTHLYEYADMKKGYHPDWKSYVFDYSKGEVISFLISSARFWFELFHIDAMRVDAVSSMIYLNYSRKEGEWTPNKYGGDGNLEALDFVKQLNHVIYRDFKGVQMIAEEATNYQWVAKPIENGGLGFGMKWMMGWMNDTLDYFKKDMLYRGAALNDITFSIMYAFNENYMLPFSHDEVVHGKSPMLYKMQGDEWQKFANLRLLYTYMYTHPGAKLMFMGNEFGQTSEWNYKTALDWHLLQFDPHQKLQLLVKDLNELYKSSSALTEHQFSGEGFAWIKIGEPHDTYLIYERKGKKISDRLIIAINLTPIPKEKVTIQLTNKRTLKERINTNDKKYWGNGTVFSEIQKGKIIDATRKIYEFEIFLPPLVAIVYQ
jgi:1,4-alpha-glucan branching enzyme